MKDNRFTSQNYWEEYYKNSNTQVSQINSVCSTYDVLWNRLINSYEGTPLRIIEIGAYPGRYLAYLASKYNLHPTAFDYNSDRAKIEETFKIMNIHEFEIIQEDFLNYNPVPLYDIVISNGFIEHFEEYQKIVSAHAGFLKKGGVMLIMVPNKRYFRKWYDWLCDYNNLKLHNTACMSKREFKKFATDNHLQAINIDYFGGFAYNIHQSSNWIQYFIYRFTRAIFKNINPIIAKYPNRYLSSVLFGIYKK